MLSRGSVLTDGKDMAYQSDEDSHHAPDTYTVFCVSPKCEFKHFYLALFVKSINFLHFENDDTGIYE